MSPSTSTWPFACVQTSRASSGVSGVVRRAGERLERGGGEGGVGHHRQKRRLTEPPPSRRGAAIRRTPDRQSVGWTSAESRRRRGPVRLSTDGVRLDQRSPPRGDPATARGTPTASEGAAQGDCARRGIGGTATCWRRSPRPGRRGECNGSSTLAVSTVTGAMNRYPRFGTVSTNADSRRRRRAPPEAW